MVAVFLLLTFRPRDSAHLLTVVALKAAVAAASDLVVVVCAVLSSILWLIVCLCYEFRLVLLVVVAKCLCTLVLSSYFFNVSVSCRRRAVSSSSITVCAWGE